MENNLVPLEMELNTDYWYLHAYGDLCIDRFQYTGETWPHPNKWSAGFGEIVYEIKILDTSNKSYYEYLMYYIKKNGQVLRTITNRVNIYKTKEEAHEAFLKESEIILNNKLSNIENFKKYIHKTSELFVANESIRTDS